MPDLLVLFLAASATTLATGIGAIPVRRGIDSTRHIGRWSREVRCKSGVVPPL
jgi:hypothetical protein